MCVVGPLWRAPGATLNGVSKSPSTSAPRNFASTLIASATVGLGQSVAPGTAAALAFSMDECVDDRSSARRRCGTAHRFTSAAIGALVLLAGKLASATEEAPPDRWTGRGTLELHVEPFALRNPTPYGLIGVSASYAPLAWLAIAGGVGLNEVGYEARHAPQVTLMPRLRWVSEHTAIGVGAGVSVGEYFWNEVWFDTGGATKRWSPAWRANIELSFEQRWAFGLLARPYLGAAAILNHGAGVCEDLRDHCLADHSSNPRAPLVYAGAAIGYAF